MSLTPLEARLTEKVAALEQENRLLREKIDLLVRRIFGRSSEAMDEGQLMLLLQGDDGAKKDPASSANPGVLEAEIEKQAEAAKPKKPRKPREARVPEHLPAVEEIIEPQEVQAAPEDGAGWAKKSPNSSTMNRRSSCAAGSSGANM